MISLEGGREGGGRRDGRRGGKESQKNKPWRKRWRQRMVVGLGLGNIVTNNSNQPTMDNGRGRCQQGGPTKSCRCARNGNFPGPCPVPPIKLPTPIAVPTVCLYNAKEKGRQASWKKQLLVPMYGMVLILVAAGSLLVKWARKQNQSPPSRKKWRGRANKQIA